MGQKLKQQFSIERAGENRVAPLKKGGTHLDKVSQESVSKKGMKRAGDRFSRSQLEEGLAELKRANEKLLGQISAYEQAENVAMAQHYFRKAIEESISLGIVAFGLDGRQIYLNPTFCRMVGWGQEGLIGAMPPFVYWPPEKIEAYGKTFRAIINQEKSIGSFEVVLQRKNGDRFDASLVYSPLKDGHGKFIGWVASVGDITGRKQAEETLRRSEESAKRLAQENAVIAEIVQIIGSTLKIEEVYERFAEEARKLIAFERININVVHFGEKTATAAYTAGKGAPVRKMGDIFPLAGSVTEEVMKTRRGVLFLPKRRAELEVRFPRLLPSFQAGHRSMMAVPLISEDRVIGSLHFTSTRPRAFAEQDLRLAENIGAQIAGAIANARLYFEQIRAEEALKRSGERLKKLSSQLLLAEEKERKRVTREIHHGIGQLLTTVKFKMERFSKDGGKSGKGKDLCQDILSLIQESINEARRIQMNLRPAMLDDLGLMPTIDWLCRVFQTTYPAVKIDKRVDLEEREVPDALKTVIYRISQEALKNISKHSKATLVVLSLNKTDNRVDLAIRDNGLGFHLQESLPAAGSDHGLGLSSMKERAELFGGSLSIESAPGKGTAVRASWPFEQ